MKNAKITPYTLISNIFFKSLSDKDAFRRVDIYRVMTGDLSQESMQLCCYTILQEGQNVKNLLYFVYF